MASKLFDFKKSKVLSLVRKIIKERDAREKAILYASTAVNYFFVAFQLYGGIRYKSVWFTALGVYYAVLTSVNLYLGLSHEKSGREAWGVFRMSGWILTIANLAIAIIISIMIAAPGIAMHNYSQTMAMGVTVWTFYLFISAIVGIVRQWKKKNVVVMAENIVRLIGATVSVLMLQTTMIASYGVQEIEGARKALEQISGMTGTSVEIEKAADELIRIFIASNRATGILAIIAVMMITTYMIVKGSREHKRKK